MTICEKVAYIKGLAEGLELDANDKNTKVLNAIIELLEDMALTVEDLEDGSVSRLMQLMKTFQTLKTSFMMMRTITRMRMMKFMKFSVPLVTTSFI